MIQGLMMHEPVGVVRTPARCSLMGEAALVGPLSGRLFRSIDRPLSAPARGGGALIQRGTRLWATVDQGGAAAGDGMPNQKSSARLAPSSGPASGPMDCSRPSHCCDRNRYRKAAHISRRIACRLVCNSVRCGHILLLTTEPHLAQTCLNHVLATDGPAVVSGAPMASGRHVGETVALSFASRGKSHMDGDLADPARRLPLPRACRTGCADNAGKQVSCARNESLLPAQRSRSSPAARAAIPGKNPTDPTRSEPLGFTPVTTEWPPTILGARGRRRADQRPSPAIASTGAAAGGCRRWGQRTAFLSGRCSRRCADPRPCCRGRRDPLPPSPFSLPPRLEMISRADARRIAVSYYRSIGGESGKGAQATSGAATWLPIWLGDRIVAATMDRICGVTQRQ